MIPFSLYIKEYFEVMITNITNFLIIFFIFQQLNIILNSLQLTKMELTRFAMKLFKYFEGKRKYYIGAIKRNVLCANTKQGSW